MAKPGYKLQEFVAHSGNVSCLKIGKKACRLFVTGGDDHNVNLWTIGKPTSLMSLRGHTSSVESVAFDSAEVLVLGGASSGVIKLWDLEESKMVRSLAGHRSNCTAVEFHPFGEFFASGSLDTNLRIWDIRKKGCIHTYKGHSQGISAIKFTPDGRWVVSGGLDNVVKVWDLTAGKLLNEFKFHEGGINSLDFHPLEFLLATGSADRTVKFWDLESFELIGSTRQEIAGVRSIVFHPDGRTLFAGLEDSLKVYSWEPVLCHDSVDMGWTTLGDLCIHDGKLLGCSFYRNSVGVWVADISLIEPYTAGLESKMNESIEQKISPQRSQLEKVEAGVGPTLGLRNMSPDIESKEIKNIYVDSSGGYPIALQRSRSYSSPKLDFSEESKEMLRQSPANGVHAKPNEQSLKKSFIAPNIVPRDIPTGKDLTKSGNETISFAKTKPGMLLRPAHVRRASTGIFDFDNVDSGSFCDSNSKLDGTKDTNLQGKVESQNEVKESCEDKHPIKSVTEKFEKTLTPERFSDQEKCVESPPRSEESTPVKYINGVAVVRGRTRSLVERFERKEITSIAEDQPNTSLTTIHEKKEKIPNASLTTIHEKKEKIPNASLTTIHEMKEKMPNASLTTIHEMKEKIPNASLTTIHEKKERIHNEDQPNVFTTLTMVSGRREATPIIEVRRNAPFIPNTVSETDKSPNILKVEPQIPEREPNSANEGEVIEGLMLTHDITLSNLRSRLTKLQVVRHFWERNDRKGAINALRKLPDKSVHADVIGVLVEKMEILTLDIFSCLLPVLTGLLDSKIERHVKVSLDLLLKLVAVFGPTIRSTVSAPPSVGVDLHAEERRECCNQCFAQLQKIQMILPILVRRGGLLAKSAQELNLVLQQS